MFQWTQLEHDVAMRSPDRGQIWENIAAALNSLQRPKFSVTASQELFEIGYTINFKTKIKAVRRRESLHNIPANSHALCVSLTPAG